MDIVFISGAGLIEVWEVDLFRKPPAWSGRARASDFHVLVKFVRSITIVEGLTPS